MSERYQGMQNQVTSLLQERSTLSVELENVKGNFTELRTRMAQSGADAGSQQAAAEMEMKFYQTKDALDRQTNQNEEMRRQQEGRLGDSTQFKQLKTIIKDKNGQIKELRAHLRQLGYQPPGDELAADSD